MSSASSAFVLEHTAFALRVARRLHMELRLPCARRELGGYAIAGLLEAQRAFDPDRGVQFTTFAYYRVRGAVLDGVRHMTPLPRRAYLRRRAAESALRDGDACKIPAANTAIGRLSGSVVLEAIGQEPLVFSRPLRCGPDPDEGEDEGLARAEDESVEVRLDRARAIARMHEAFEALEPEEQLVVRGLYFEERTLDQIGAVLGISKSWASRIHTRALRRMRQRIE